MAEKLRREKDILQRATSSYLKSTASDYSKYLEGSPVFITYYSLLAPASTQDVGLEAVNELIGKDSPKKFKKIQDCVIYGVDTMDIMSSINERGLVSSIQGEFIMIPDTVRPYPNDFFVFDYEGMERHLFRITDVQFDRATVEKYFKCQYVLYPDNVDEILNNVAEDYTLVYDNIGTGANSVIESSQAATNSAAQKMCDALIDRFLNGYYSEEMDAFVYTNNGTEYYWNPYLQKFIYETKCVKKYHKELLTEIYLTDINQAKNPNIFKEWSWRKSLFNAVITKNKITVPMTFLAIYDDPNIIMESKNLPFFRANQTFRMAGVIEYIQNTDIADCTPGWHFILDPYLDNPKFRYSWDGHKNKVHKMDELHLQMIAQNLSNGDMVYEANRNEIEATKICQVFEEEGDLDIVDASLEGIYKNVDGRYKEDLLIDIIFKYLENTLTITDDLLKRLNEYFYDISIKNYTLLPIVIYIIQMMIGGK